MSCTRCMEASGLCAECEAYLCEARPSYTPIEDPESRIHFLCAVSVASLRRLLGPDFDKYVITARTYNSATATEQLDYVRKSPALELVFTAAPPPETFFVTEFKL